MFCFPSLGQFVRSLNGMISHYCLLIVIRPAVCVVGNKKKSCGDGGYRSPYLSHAKRALYHLSYVPSGGCDSARLATCWLKTREEGEL